MKTIGMLGGMSWESTVTYYQLINQTIKEKLGGLHSAKCLLYSVDFAEIEEYQSKGKWDEVGGVLAAEAAKLEAAGADFIVICTNTMHKVSPQIEAAISIPIIHIAEATADQLEKSGISKVALLGTKYTMTQDFYKRRLTNRGIEVLIPTEKDIELVNSVIYNQLCRGILSAESKAEHIRIIRELVKRGAQGVILGCTEIGLLIKQEDVEIPLFDTAVIHATKAALTAIEG